MMRAIGRKRGGLKFSVALAASAWACLLAEAGFGGEIDLPLAKRYFAHAEALCAKEGGRTWGRNLHGPCMFIDPKTRAIVTNQADAEGILKEKDGVWVGTMPAENIFGNTATTWAGVRWTMVMWPPARDDITRGQLLTHEMFHRIQDEIGLPIAPYDNGHLDTRDGRVWLRLEWRALRAALTASDAQRKSAIEDALVFRAYRRSLFPDRTDDECAFEMHEGMAEYTGFVAGGVPKEQLAGRVGVHLMVYDQQDPIVLSFAYASGPAYGVLLDAATNDWRRDVSPRTDLGKLLAGAYGVKLPGNLTAAAAKRARRYDGQKIMVAEDRRDEERKRRIAKYQARFVDGPTLTCKPAGEIRYSYNPNGIHDFPGHGKVYITARVTDEWGELEVTEGGVLFVTSSTGVIEKLVLPASPDPTSRPIITGDGWKLTLKPGWTLHAGPRKGDFEIARAAY